MLGIPNYQPNFCNNTGTFINVFGDNLLSTIGLTLDDYWLMWETDANEWYNDGPVILKIADRQFEFAAYKLDEFSLTIDQIDLNEKLDWCGLGDELPLTWKNKAHSNINKLIGRKITNIHIVEFNFIGSFVEDKVNAGKVTETGFMLHGIEFEFEKNGQFDNDNFLQIFNALDANGVTTKELKKTSNFKKLLLTIGRPGNPNST